MLKDEELTFSSSLLELELPLSDLHTNFFFVVREQAKWPSISRKVWSPKKPLF